MNNLKEKTKASGSIRLGDVGRFLRVMGLLAAAWVLGLFLNVNIGSVSIGTGEIFGLLWDGVRCWVGSLFGGDAYLQQLDAVMRSTTASQILFRIRLPRMLLAMLLGGGLSVSGYLLQVFFRNPIVGPFVLGISSGAKMMVGVTLIFLAPLIGSFTSMTLILAAFLGSLLITALVLLFSQKVRNMSMLLVIGIMVGYICSAVTDFAITFANDHDIVNLTGWSLGSFSGATWANVRSAGWVCIPGTAAALLLSKPISAYALGEGYARSMGISTRRVRMEIILVSSLLSACVTALAGPISFVGIAVPHIVRSLLKTSRPAFVIPASFLCGGVVCMFCDLIARTAFAPAELSIGTVTSVFGAPVVIGMMLRRHKDREV